MNHFELAPEQWATLRQLLDEALDRPQQERATWLEQLDPQFDAFKPRLRSLLEHAAKATRALPIDTLPKVETAQFLADRAQPGNDAEPAVGNAVGPYRLVRPLGEGGMGSVWLAERSDMLVKRQVALKLPHLAWRRARLAERLEREREILAALNHPNIARLYDAGISADGQPFLALEYVEGERIDAYCTRKALDVPARLRLFLQVARAVAHAHANLIVHRDLKPTNILVTEAGDVKLLDFGIAKLLEDGHARETELTQLAGRALTPDYAAPEQILGQPIGTAADVYALGVVLFELLTGTRPYQLKRDSCAALEEAIVQADVSRPSAVAADAKLKKRLRGDLDTIVLKALKKLPAERYGTVEALADDIERHLDRRPVRAQADSRVYRLSRFITRNRLAVAATSGIVLATGIGAAVTAWQARVALGEKQRAERVTEFISSVFEDADPYKHNTGTPVTALDLLKRAQSRVDAELSQQPLVRAELLRLIGRGYAGLFDLAAAESALSQSLTGMESSPRRNAAKIAEVHIALGEVKKLLGKYAEAEALLIKAMGLLRDAGLERSGAYADARLLEAGLAMYQGQSPRALAAAEEAAHVSVSALGENNLRAAVAYGLLARISHPTNDSLKQREMAERALRIQLSHRNDDYAHPSVIEAQEVLGVALIALGDIRGAGPHIQQAHDNARRVYGERNVMTGNLAVRVGQLQILRGELDAGIRTTLEALAVLDQIDASRGVASAGRKRSLALGLLWALRPAEALTALEQAEAISVERSDARALHVVRTYQVDALIQLGRLDEAKALLEATERSGRTLDPPELPLRQRASWHLVRGEPEAAAAPLRAALAHARADPRQLFLPDTLAATARMHLDSGRPAEAKPYLEEAQSIWAQRTVGMTPNQASTLVLLGRMHLSLGEPAEAAVPLGRADKFWRDFDAGGRGAGEAAFWLARAHQALGQNAEANAAYSRSNRILAKSPFPADAQLLQQAHAGAIVASQTNGK